MHKKEDLRQKKVLRREAKDAKKESLKRKKRLRRKLRLKKV
jgi:hypothetical protein